MRSWKTDSNALLFGSAGFSRPVCELPVTLKLNGSYHDMGQFASDIGQLSRIVTLNDIGLTGSKDGSLVMDVTAKTFRYLDDEEVSAQTRAAKGVKAGKK